MQKIDHVLQARERIAAMADELRRVKDAASLLDGAQRKTEALIEASEALVEHAGEFANEGVEIIQRLKAMDLDRRLGEISRSTAETQQLMDRQFDRLGTTLQQLKARNQDIADASGSLQARLDETHQKTIQQMRSTAQETQQVLRDSMQSLSKGLTEHLRQMNQAQRDQREATTKRYQRMLTGMTINALLLVTLLAVTLL